MSDPGMLEEWCRKEKKRNNNIFYDGKSLDPSQGDLETRLSLSKFCEKTSCAENTTKTERNKGKVDYEVDNEGNLDKVVVSYNIDGRRYEMSLSISYYPEDHIRLEIRRKYKNPLKNIFDRNLLASSVTPIHIPAYHRGCLWASIRNDEIKYPSDRRCTSFVRTALNDIKVMSSEIEKDMEYKSGYEDRMRQKEKEDNTRELKEENRKKQEKLKGKNKKDFDFINFFINKNSIKTKR